MEVRGSLMPDRYFENFPKIVYSNTEIVDITKRTAILNRVGSNPYVFYPYELSTYERPDQFSFRYYQDEYASWILYLTNKVLDPYYEWYLQPDEFLALIEMKYGSIPLAQRKVKYYRNNWVGENGTFLSASNYNALTEDQKIYYEPLYNSEGFSKQYKRKEADWIADTNKIYCYGVDTTDNFLKSFIPDEIVKIYIDKNHIGYGQFDSYRLNTPLDYETTNEYSIFVTRTTTANTINLKHMTGEFATNVEKKILVTGESYLEGSESGLKVNMLNINPAISPDGGVVRKLAENIKNEVAKYWSPVTYFEYENEMNEYNKTVRVMDSRYKAQAAQDLKRLMKE